MMEKKETEWLEWLIDRELERANRKFAQFSSLHEAHSVLLEEVEETEEELQQLKESFCKLWRMIRLNEEERAFNAIEEMGLDIRHLIQEAIQVAAMCKKAKKLASKKGD